MPVRVSNGKWSRLVNALLDYASTKSYINSKVAAELGLTRDAQIMNVNVLNGYVKTLHSTDDVSCELTSCD